MTGTDAGRAVAYTTTPVVALLDAEHHPIPLRPRVRQALALLLRHREVGISDDDLVAGIWPTLRPRHPDAALRTVLSRLRDKLPPGSLQRTTSGYRLAGLHGPGHVPPPLLGRDTDLHSVARLLDTHDAVLVTGPFGIGKSRLLAEFSAVGTSAAPPRPSRWQRIVVLPPTVAALRARAGTDDDPVAALRRRSGHSDRTPALVVADDIHRAEPAIIDLLTALAEMEPLRILAASPTDREAPGTVTDRLRAGRWAHHALGPLDDAASAALGHIVGAVEVSAAHGNPELICALARDGAAAGHGVADTVRRRLAGLPEHCADALALVVLAGALDWRTAHELDVLDAVATLEDHGLVATDTEGARAASALIAEATEQSLGPARRSHVADRLYATATTPVMRASWGLRTNRPVAVADLLAAGAFHLTAGDPDSAERFAAAAWRAEPTPEAGFVWAHAMTLGTLPGHEIAARLAAVQATLPVPSPAIDTAAAISVFLKDAEPGPARDRLRAPGVDAHPMAQVADALIRTYTGRPDPDTPWRVLSQQTEPAVRGAAWATWFLAADLTGDRSLTARLPDPTTAADEGLSSAQLHAMRARAHLRSDDPVGAEREIAAARSATTLGDLRMRAWLATLRSELAFWNAEFAESASRAGHAVELLHRSRHVSDERIARHWLALTLAAAGDPEGASTALVEADRMPAAAVIGEHHGDAARALIAVGRGEPDAAVWLERGRSRAERHGITDDLPLEVVSAVLAPASTTSGPGITAHPVRTRIVDHLRRATAHDPRMARLTARERQILRLYRQRFTAREIAAQLGISSATVRNHVAHGFRTLGVHARGELPDGL
ncbi:LuxR C-terminal-related transcriptional regulator [Gordonia sp. 'Campus']|uniref:LuxR C-terminal-related transcriptional regulator n=1 Tax=Gordonia sp. 'Campus' TaxID=2915824 RepID=UPI001EE3CD3B|nr:LuxR C-terminal-related transcriptional regulator [Gordonia sp. 'Campus']